MNPQIGRAITAPVLMVLGVFVAVIFFVVITQKGIVIAIGIAAFLALLLGSLSSTPVAFASLIASALLEGLYKGAVANMLTMLVKDIFLAILLLRLLWISQRSRDYRWLQQPMTTAGVVFVAYCLALMFAPSTRSLLLALAGLRAWILWMPVYFPAYSYFASKQVIIKVLTVLLLVQLPIAVYGIIQGNIGYEHTKVLPGFYQNTRFYQVDVNVNPLEQVAESGEDSFDEGYKPIMTVRACSILVSPGTLGSMSVLTILLGIGLLAYTRSNSLRIWALATALAGAGALLASGSRAPIFGLGASVATLVFMSRQRGVTLVGLMLIGLASIFVLKDLAGGGAVRLEKRLSFVDAIERSMMPLQVGLDLGLKHPFGAGIATGTGMGRMFYNAGLQAAEGARFIENEFGRALAELGFVGTGVWLYMILSIMWHSFRAVRELGTRPEGALCAALFAVMVGIFVQLGVGSALYNASPGMYFWIFGAAILRLRQFANEETAAPEQKVDEEYRPELHNGYIPYGYHRRLRQRPRPQHLPRPQPPQPERRPA